MVLSQGDMDAELMPHVQCIRGLQGFDKNGWGGVPRGTLLRQSAELLGIKGCRLLFLAERNVKGEVPARSPGWQLPIEALQEWAEVPDGFQF